MTEQNSDLIAGRYQLLERIGQGGMGRVWRGVDRQLFGREVAVKEILFPPGLEDGDRAGLLARFTAEARAAVTISHPGIITVHDVVEHRGAPVIVMEFIRGESLAAAIRRQGRLPVERVAEIGSALLDALAEAHGARIVHRDIKPDNVLLTKDRVVLTDFGIAHLADATTKLSHSGIVIGTPQYMAPEQLEGRRPTAANDLWALGATLYHAVEGRPPFEADGLHALAVAVFTRPHRQPVHAGPLAPVLDALLTKDPGQRAGLAEASGLLASVVRAARPAAGTDGPDAPTPAPTPTKREEPPPTPPAEDLVTLGRTERGGPGGQAPARRRVLTRRGAVWGLALATLAAGSVLTWTLDRDDPSGPGGTGGTGATGGGSATAPVTVVIGVEAPLSGELSSFGAGIRNSADLAARTANRTRHVPGVNFEIKALDDEGLPAKGAPNAARFTADEKVLGVVGPFTSAAARTFVAPLAGANLVNVSPSNTDPALTLGPHWADGAPSRPYDTYFRTVATDVDQGPFAARHLHDEAGKSRLYVIDDAGEYGAGLAAGVAAEFRKLGGSLVGTDHVDPAQGGFSELASKVRASGADAVYFGGYHTTAAPLSRQLKEAGVTAPLMGGDGIFDQQFLTANTRAEGDLATNPGEPAERLARGAGFLAEYRAAGYPEAAGAYGPYAYDAAWALVEAVKAVVAANGGTLPADARARMARAVAGLGFDGVTGRVAFDEYGDTRNRRLTVYRVTGGTWTTVTSGSRSR
ncbi:bifunctional serine/threonine-protein kinase/ABC transporter substrate-binding protein [Streptomyces sp. NBC_00158]|uniref:bifunctional serine/threonine-protein kinase/ABC transporter substrate-binding protein n=1 Tax=Streptomyces sp. NBC_00158 TaxID=2903627 RepID=UPI00324A8F23